MKKIALSLILSIIITASMSSLSFAAETKDTTLPTEFIDYSDKATSTLIRSKTNTTPVYIDNQSGKDLYVYANGGGYPSGVRPTVLYSAGTTVNYHAVVKPGKYAIHSTIYEKGYRKAWLNISAAKRNITFKCKGVWSPDSAGSYNPAN